VRTTNSFADWQAKMGEKAFNLKVGEVRDLCDFFALDRSGVNAKAELIDRLLDFLSEPSAEHVKGNKAAAKASSSASKRKGGSGKKKKKDDSSEEESDEDDEEEEEEEETEATPKKGKKEKGVDLHKVEKGKVPTDDTLRAWVKCFVQCYDLEKASIKVALQVAGDKFGVDLGDKKDLLKEMLAEAMG
jgi:ribosomal protein L12E/L44/L45/RPP1/RPP2